MLPMYVSIYSVQAMVLESLWQAFVISPEWCIFAGVTQSDTVSQCFAVHCCCMADVCMSSQQSVVAKSSAHLATAIFWQAISAQLFPCIQLCDVRNMRHTFWYTSNTCCTSTPTRRSLSRWIEWEGYPPASILLRQHGHYLPKNCSFQNLHSRHSVDKNANSEGQQCYCQKCCEICCSCQGSSMTAGMSILSAPKLHRVWRNFTG